MLEVLSIGLFQRQLLRKNHSIFNIEMLYDTYHMYTCSVRIVIKHTAFRIYKSNNANTQLLPDKDA